MASSAGLASLGTLVEKFQLDVYKKALKDKGKPVPDSADIKDLLVYEPDVPPTALLKSLNADLTQRVGRPTDRAHAVAEALIAPESVSLCGASGGCSAR